jgi:Fe-S cluster assembly protein SufB
MSEKNEILEEHISSDYKYGFVSDIDTEFAPKGLNEDIVRFISTKKNEPEWMLEYRLKAFRHWLTMEEPKHRSTFRTSAIMRRRRKKQRWAAWKK